MARSVYAKIADLRQLLPDETAYPDTQLTALLELASAMIEDLTQQFFGPRYIDTLVDGLGKRAIKEIKQNKVIEVESLAYRRSDGSFRFVEPRYYEVTDSERRIRLRTILKYPLAPDRAFLAGSSVNGLTFGRAIPAGAPARRFPYDDANVHMKAFFGWLELTEKHETVLAADLAAGATAVSLEDTDDILLDELLLIDRKFWVIACDVTTPSIAYDPGPPEVLAVPGVVSIDPSPKSASAGAEVIRFGSVPLLIRHATLRTAMAQRFGPGSDEEIENSIKRNIRREETDNYEIEFFSSSKGGGGGVPETGTGDPYADAILSRYRAPTVSGEWA